MLLTYVEIALLALAPWPLYRLLSIPVFRRSYFCFALRVLGILLVYTAVIVWLVIYTPILLHVAAAVAVLVLLMERLRARPGYGETRNLPPGSLSLVPRQPWVDDRFFAKTSERYGPVFKISHYFRPMICIIGARRGLALMAAHDDDLLPPKVRFNEFIPRGFLRYMSPSDHDKYKKLLQRVISRSVLRGTETDVRYIIQSGLELMATDSAIRRDAGIDPREYLSDMLLAVFARMFFGIRKEDETLDELKSLYRRIDIKKASCASSRQEIHAAEQIADVIQRNLAHLEEQNRNDEPLPSCVLTEFVRQDLVAEFDRTVVLNLVYIVQAGRADMSGLLAWALKLLCDNDSWLLKIREDLLSREADEGEAPSNLASRVIKEVLRLEQSEFLFRKVAKDIEFENFTIPKGWSLRICIREGHRDGDIFSDPHQFDPDRFEQKFTKEEYSPLGMLRHSCLGAQIVDMIGALFVCELARSYDCVATRDGPREYGRAHWEPSGRFRIALARVAAPRIAKASIDYGVLDSTSA
jgi:cytochrome P450